VAVADAIGVVLGDGVAVSVIVALVDNDDGWSCVGATPCAVVAATGDCALREGVDAAVDSGVVEVGVASEPGVATGVAEVEDPSGTLAVGVDEGVVEAEVGVTSELDVALGVDEAEGAAVIVAVGVDEGAVEVEVGVTSEPDFAVGVGEAESVIVIVAVGVDEAVVEVEVGVTIELDVTVGVGEAEGVTTTVAVGVAVG
jgi:hypothetical protein